MALLPNALTDLDRVREAIKGLTNTATEISRLTALINAVTATFEQETRRKLKERTYKATGAVTANGEENLLLHGHNRISTTAFLLPQYPVSSVSAITVKQEDLLSANQTVLTSTDWTVIQELGLVKLITGNEFPLGWNNIEMTWTGGVPTTSLAYATLQEACNEQVREFWYRGLRAQDGVASMSDAGGSVTFSQAALLPSVRLVLDTFKPAGVRLG